MIKQCFSKDFHLCVLLKAVILIAIIYDICIIVQLFAVCFPEWSLSTFQANIRIYKQNVTHSMQQDLLYQVINMLYTSKKMRKLSVVDKQIYELQQWDVQDIIMKTSNNIHVYYNGQIQVYSIKDNVILNTIILPEIESYDADNPDYTSILTQSMIEEPSYIAGVFEKTILYYKYLVLNMYNIETNKIKQTRISEKKIVFAKQLLTNILIVQLIQNVDSSSQQSNLKYYYIDETGYLNALPDTTLLYQNSQIVDIQIIDNNIEQIYFLVFQNGQLAILQPPIRMNGYLPDKQPECVTYLDVQQFSDMKLLAIQYLYPQNKESQAENTDPDNVTKRQFFAVYDKAVVILKSNEQNGQVFVQYVKKFDNIQLMQASYNFNTQKLIVQTKNKDVIIYQYENGTLKKLVLFKEKFQIKKFAQHNDNEIFSYLTSQNTLVSFTIAEKTNYIPPILVASVFLVAILIMVIMKRSINLKSMLIETQNSSSIAKEQYILSNQTDKPDNVVQ